MRFYVKNREEGGMERGKEDITGKLSAEVPCLLFVSSFIVNFTFTRIWAGRQRNCGSILGKGKILYFSPNYLDRIWGLSLPYSVGTGCKLAGN